MHVLSLAQCYNCKFANMPLSQKDRRARQQLERNKVSALKSAVAKVSRAMSMGSAIVTILSTGH
jgi:hypothetical protein